MPSLGQIDALPSTSRNSQTRRLAFQPNVFQLTFACSCLILVLLQFWRPYFFLGDDNLTFILPAISTVGDRLLHGQSPAYNPYLFGGLNLAGDPAYFSLFNPIVLGLSLLSDSPFYLAIIDLMTSIYLLLGAMCFTLLLRRLRELKSLELSDGRLVFLSLSFTFSAYSLGIGSCWSMFMANAVSLSLLTLGLLAERRAVALRYITGGVLFGLLFGHLSPFVYTLLFFSLFVLGLCWTNRSWLPLKNWCLGVLLGMVLLSPLLVPAARGFLGSSRSASYNIQHLTENLIPAPALILGFFSGFVGVVLGGAMGLFRQHYINGVASCAAAFMVFGGLPRGRKLTRLEISVGVLAVVVAFFVVRPLWLANFVSHVPLYRSLRWPFRETLILLFFVHLWIALRPVTMKPRSYVANNMVGFALFFASQIAAGPWSFSPHEVDRELLMTGKADAYWQRLKPLIGPEDRLIPVIDPIFSERQHEIPYSLLGAFNYPSLFKVRSLSGFTSQGLRKDNGEGLQEMDPDTGFYTFAGGRRMLARTPHLKTLCLTSLDPPSIDLCSVSGCKTLEVPVYTRKVTPWGK